MTIQNGMTVKLNNNITATTLQSMDVDLINCQRLFGKKFKLEKGGSTVLDDGRVMIKGIGQFPKEIFIEVPVDDENYSYCIVIITKDCVGEYTHYDDVVDHEINTLGVHIECEDGTEHFHPWSFDGGIERITKKESF